VTWKSLQRRRKKWRSNITVHNHEIWWLEKKITEVEERKHPLCKGDMSVIEESLATSNKFFLPQDGMWKGKNKVTHLREGLHGPYMDSYM
jgi:hypothetical protein